MNKLPSMNFLRSTSLRWAVCGLLGGFGLLTSVVRAQLKAEPESVEMGKFGQNKIATAEVVLVNTGKDPLEILSVGADCSCTAATPEKTSLKPGERTSLKITMETRVFQGEVHRRLVVQTSEGDLAIPVKVLIAPYENWSIDPYPVVVPPGPRGKETATTVQFTYTGNGEGEIKTVTGLPALLSTQLTKQEGKTFTYTLTRLATAPSGNHNVKLTVETSDPVNPKLEFNVFVPVASTLRVSPSPLIFPPTKVGQAVTLSGKLSGWKSPGEPRFELKQGEVKALNPEGDARGFEITLTPKAPGSFTQLFRVYDGERLELEVPLVLRVEQ